MVSLDDADPDHARRALESLVRLLPYRAAAADIAELSRRALAEKSPATAALAVSSIFAGTSARGRAGLGGLGRELEGLDFPERHLRGADDMVARTGRTALRRHAER